MPSVFQTPPPQPPEDDPAFDRAFRKAERLVAMTSSHNMTDNARRIAVRGLVPLFYMVEEIGYAAADLCQTLDRLTKAVESRNGSA